MSHVYPYGYSARYPSIALTVTSPLQSFTEPLSVEEMKLYLKVPDPSQDELIASLIRAARAEAEILQKRDLVQKQWDLTMDGWPGNRLALATPLASIDLVRYRDSDGNYTTLTEDTDYIVDTVKSPGELASKGSYWPSYNPWDSSSVLIRFTSGYAADDPWWLGPGDLVKSGMRLRIADLFYDRMPRTIKGADSAEVAMSIGGILTVR